MYRTAYRPSIRSLSTLLIGVLVFLLIPVSAFGAAQWVPNTPYLKGDIVTYQAVNYECIQPHTSLTGWEPPAVQALWKVSTQPSDTIAPSVPASLQSPAHTSNSVSLTWQASTDNVAVTGYNVYNGSSVVGTTTNLNYQVNGLASDTLYTFKVAAFDAAGNVSAPSANLDVRTDAAPPDAIAPTAPTNVRSTSITANTIALAWNASTDNVGVTQYEIVVNGQVASTSAATAWTATGLTANTVYTIVVRALDAAGNRSADSTSLSVATLSTNPPLTTAKVLVGYWHNFDNGSTNIRLRDVSSNYDVINVSFAEPVGDYATMAFTPYNSTKEQFKADILELQGKGKKVNISLGGANGTVELTTAAAKQSFITTMNNIINEYGFNGIDIDLEGSSLSLNGGDTDFRNPTTPKIVNLISAIQTILTAQGSNFMLTMAPETAYVQGGITGYGGPWGAYLPVIYAFKDRMNFIHVQHYNTGAMTALDGRSYSQGTADFQVAMAEMLLQGFPIAGNANNKFPALREDQVAIGLPSTPNAASGGFTAAADIDKAVKYLTKGIGYGGTYQLMKPGGYTNFRGVMTWSINWDKKSNLSFSNPVRATLDGLK
ncbi:fibronectin type III domain-containing protein [Paenibacillus taiwanensis]|uniref:fibronectin type III domain-containing protein n=1 Tax=Paenibacillus taiwanensis TaxID=401638 RepID=UPI00042461B8|nr:glycosyl hydrolase family 18 protein [Paenibacillus taiwanensis]